MKRETYRKARQALRANGRAALRWFPAPVAAELRALLKQSPDPLKHRAWVVQVWGPASPMLRAELQQAPAFRPCP